MEAPDTEPENFDYQVKVMLDGLTEDFSIWKSISERFKIDMFCGWFMNESNEGVEIAPETLLALGQRHILLGLDIYGPDEKDEQTVAID